MNLKQPSSKDGFLILKYDDPTLFNKLSAHTSNFAFLCILLFSFFQNIFQTLFLFFFKVFPVFSCFGPSTWSTFPRIFFSSRDKVHPAHKKSSHLVRFCFVQCILQHMLRILSAHDFLRH